MIAWSENLPDYVEEKTVGEYKAKDVISIAEDIRSMDFDKIDAADVS